MGQFSTCAVLVAMALQAPAPAGTPDFTGVWVADAARSTHSKVLKPSTTGAPEAPPAPGQAISRAPTMRIAQKDLSVTLELLDDQSAPISTLKLTVDGQENVNTRAGGALSQVSTTRWDRAALVTTWRLNRDDQTVLRGVDRWELSENRETLTVSSQLEDSTSRTESQTVYTRKP